MTQFEIELRNGARYEVSALIRPDAHTSAYVREQLFQILHERYGVNNESEIKTFRYPILGV
jgi:hypothetical protein